MFTISIIKTRCKLTFEISKYERRTQDMVNDTMLKKYYPKEIEIKEANNELAKDYSTRTIHQKLMKT